MGSIRGFGKYTFVTILGSLHLLGKLTSRKTIRKPYGVKSIELIKKVLYHSLIKLPDSIYLHITDISSEAFLNDMCQK